MKGNTTRVCPTRNVQSETYVTLNIVCDYTELQGVCPDHITVREAASWSAVATWAGGDKARDKSALTRLHDGKRGETKVLYQTLLEQRSRDKRRSVVEQQTLWISPLVFDADYGTPINPSIPSFHRYDADQWYPTQSKASMFFTGVMLITGTQLISSVPSFRKYDANQWNTT
ncbi:hypothetical protein RRG08_025076 [Elysia crispata]|uniref:Uncharacterized protein n=1 Tax=Elysia crispata TaxID=231223 RepID=A0AAE1AIM5_9GAST|nr:hypothetical protein RRG08_025076 [Elysia crispata]